MEPDGPPYSTETLGISDFPVVVFQIQSHSFSLDTFSIPSPLSSSQFLAKLYPGNSKSCAELVNCMIREDVTSSSDPLKSFWLYHKASGILVPRPVIKPAPPALEALVLTTGPPGKSKTCHFLILILKRMQQNCAGCRANQHSPESFRVPSGCSFLQKDPEK